MFKAQLVACFLFANLSAFAADSTSSVEGRVIDGQGRPMSGVTVAVQQVQPLKGYEQFRAITKADGTFAIAGLYPNSDYYVVVGIDEAGWFCLPVEHRLFNAAPHGETRVFPSDIVARFQRFASGIITDTETGLQWRIGPAEKTTLEEARRWIATLPTDGGPAWSLPTPEQVGTLLHVTGNQRLFHREMADLEGVWSFLTTGNKVTTRASRMHEGAAWMTFMDSRGTRAIAVRSASPEGADATRRTSDRKSPAPQSASTVIAANDQRERQLLELQMTKTPNDFWYATDDVIVLVMPKKPSGTLTRDDHIQALRDALTEADQR